MSQLLFIYTYFLKQINKILKIEFIKTTIKYKIFNQNQNHIYI